MAETIDKMPERKWGRPAKYNWATLLDGEPHRLRHSVDFPDVKDAKTFRMMVYTAAKRAGTRARAYLDEQDPEVVYIQQYDADDDV